MFFKLIWNLFSLQRNVFSAVFLVWLVSLCMSFLPIFMGWNLIDPPPSPLPSSSSPLLTAQSSNTTSTAMPATSSSTKVLCAIEANRVYAIISSSLSFWIPLVVMALLYIRIYIVAKRQAHAMAKLTNMQNQHRKLANSRDMSLTNLAVTSTG